MELIFFGNSVNNVSSTLLFTEPRFCLELLNINSYFFFFALAFSIVYIALALTLLILDLSGKKKSKLDENLSKKQKIYYGCLKGGLAILMVIFVSLSTALYHPPRSYL